ncbi:M23 family metallopeptidase [Phreatobacter sp. AB_2022a]|uniref:M23 family metallopeptidase n=1 Tax=Phreatobacter sp. AB_2022a TaxID=3003134 RepID=UPI002287056D|nr:M23 family metallopeptidase [Phreatobacter sp. AB_2022a]MCZ0736195.1 M23 family metallopeptidase [Phreatobacter sp. AB_2022a]
MQPIRRSTYGRQNDEPTLALGNEPPLSADGSTRRGIEGRGINVRWFSGTVLTGLCGAGLMGGAVWAALENPTRPAAPAEIMAPLVRAAGPVADRPTNTARKGDRLTPLADAFATSKQTIRVSQTLRVGDREIIRVRPHTRVVANLVQTSSGDYDIPEFNPLRLLAGDQPERAPEAEPDTDGEMTIVTRDMSGMALSERSMMTLTTDEILTRVREVAMRREQAIPVALPQPPVQAGADPGLDPAAPNVSRVQKADTPAATSGQTPPDRVAVAKAGDTISSIMLELGATREDARLIAMAFSRGGREITLRENQRVRVLFALGPSGRQQPVRIIVLGDRAPESAVALSDEGRYVAMEDPADAATITQDAEEEDEGSGMRLYNAIYETALRQEIPKPIIDEMIRLYSHDVDFNRRVGPGDLFEVFYASDEEGDAERGDILYTSLTTGGETRRFYRFHSTADGVVDYYDQNGKSARKFLIRKPITSGQMRSEFGMRRHPIMGYYKMHTGVDWADRIGTPIIAAGNGTVIKAGWQSGYGRRIEIEHANGYTSTYSHMSGFARGISEGVRVRQGQVIGYLGNTGLATGPHLHYEVLVNGRFVDPMRVRVPRGRELEGRALAEFIRERDRIDALMTRDRAETRVTAETRR